MELFGSINEPFIKLTTVGCFSRRTSCPLTWGNRNKKDSVCNSLLIIMFVYRPLKSYLRPPDQLSVQLHRALHFPQKPDYRRRPAQRFKQ